MSQDYEELRELARRMAGELDQVVKDAEAAGSDQPRIRTILSEYRNWVGRNEGLMTALRELPDQDEETWLDRL